MCQILTEKHGIAWVAQKIFEYEQTLHDWMKFSSKNQSAHMVWHFEKLTYKNGSLALLRMSQFL